MSKLIISIEVSENIQITKKCKVSIWWKGASADADTSDPQNIIEHLTNTRDLSQVYDGKYPGSDTGHDTFSTNRIVLHQ